MDCYGYVDLPRGPDDSLHFATVIKRANDYNGLPIGKSHLNPSLDSRMYEVECINGTIEIQSANIILENILSQVDEGGIPISF